MARPIRVEFENAVYHVTARGNERQKIFRSDEDNALFVKACSEMVGRFGILVHAHCLMPNHYHLAISTPRANLSQGIGWLQTVYTIRFNRKYKRSGHLFQGRFKAHMVEADEYARILVPYIHLNPVRPRDKRAPIDIKRLKEFENYPWSNHREYVGKRSEPWVNMDWLSYWGTHEKKAREEYSLHVRGYFGKATKSPWEDLKKGFVLGSESYLDKIKGYLTGKKGQEETKWMERENQGAVQKKVEALVAGEPDERIQMWILSRLGGWRMVNIGRRYGYKDGSGALHMVRRLEAIHDKLLKKKLEALGRNMSRFKS